MRKMVERPFADYFNPNLEEVDSIALNLPASVRWKRVINPFVIVFSLMAVTLFFGMFSNIALSLFVGLSVFLTYNYFRTKAVAKRLHVERQVSSRQCFEFDEIIANYRIVNAAKVFSPPFLLKDFFDSSQDRVVELEISEPLPANSYKTFTVKRICDGGMGVKSFGPVSIHLTDPFGIFEFTITEDDPDWVEVLPKIEEVPELAFKGSPHSDRYGIYDVQSKGNSVNFVGVREYQSGDSLRNVAWKLSAKRGDLFVKEFENMVNAEISLFLNLRPNLHQGAPGFSTWELTKDISLSLVTQQIEKANTVKVFTQNFFIESLRGEQDTHELAQQLIKVDPLQMVLDGHVFDEALGNSPSATKLIEQYIEMQRPGSNVVLITPFVTNEANSLSLTLGGLRQLGCEVYVILSGSSWWQQGTEALEAKHEGDIIYHDSHVPHAIKTESDYLLCFYAWSGNLATKPVASP